MGGSAGLGLHPPASVPPDPATRLSGWPHWVTIPPKLQSAFYSAGKYSVGTNGVLRKLKLKQKCLLPTESCFLDGKKPNIAKLVDINFLADNEKNRQAIGLRKWKGKWLFSANPMKMCLFGYFCMQNSFLH